MIKEKIIFKALASTITDNVNISPTAFKTIRPYLDIR